MKIFLVLVGVLGLSLSPLAASPVTDVQEAVLADEAKLATFCSAQKLYDRIGAKYQQNAESSDADETKVRAEANELDKSVGLYLGPKGMDGWSDAAKDEYFDTEERMRKACGLCIWKEDGTCD